MPKAKNKICGVCKIEKDINEFWKNKNTKDGLRYCCKMCDNEFSKAFYYRHKEKRREYNKRGYTKRKQMIRKLKINGCAICSYNKCDAALEFHHVNPDDKKFEINTSRMTRKNKSIVKELQKCILLCSNCHKEIEEKEREEILHA